MDGFQVDPGALDSAADALEIAADELGADVDSLQEGAGVDLGPAGITEAADALIAAQLERLRGVHADVVAAAGLTREAGAGYRRLDEEAAEELRGAREKFDA